MFGSHGHEGSPCPIPGREKVIRNFHLLHRPCALILSVKHDYYNYIVWSFLIQGVAFGVKSLAFFEARSGFGAIFLICSIPFLAHLSSAQDELLWSLLSVVRPCVRASVRPSVRPSVNIFKRLLLWSRWANFAQISYGASLGWGNERLLKWSRSVD